MKWMNTNPPFTLIPLLYASDSTTTEQLIKFAKRLSIDQIRTVIQNNNIETIVQLYVRFRELHTTYGTPFAEIDKLFKQECTVEALFYIFKTTTPSKTRMVELEPKLFNKGNPIDLYVYAVHLKTRLPKAEHLIAVDPAVSLMYAKNFKMRFFLAEPTILATIVKFLTNQEMERMWKDSSAFIEHLVWYLNMMRLGMWPELEEVFNDPQCLPKRLTNLRDCYYHGQYLSKSF